MSNSLQQDYKKLSNKLDGVSGREQFLIFGCGLVVVILLSYSLLIEPMYLKAQQLDKRSKSAQLEITTLSAELAGINRKLKQNPNVGVLERIEKLDQEIVSVDEKIHQHTRHLVPATKMATLLENILVETKGLKLLELTSIAPTPLLIDASSEGDEDAEAIYRHGMTLIFEGNYFDVQRYLQKIESLNWQFYWKKFDYLVSDYPTSKVELEIYTLSTNKAFIGV